MTGPLSSFNQSGSAAKATELLTPLLRPSVDEIHELVGLRRSLHQDPELRFAEHGTSRLLRGYVEPHCDQLVRGVAGTGIVATLHAGEPGPHVLVRADMDAYPVDDSKKVPYTSRRPGAAHACGHDVHMAVAVGVLRRLHAERPSRGSVTILFQPAEEIPFGASSGARAVLRTGVLRTEYSAVLGLHCWPQLPAETVGVDRDVAMAAKDAFQIELRGRTAHAATPAIGRDAILAASSLVSSLHAAVSRRKDPGEMAALNVGTISGGRSQSVVADRVVLTGTLRTHEQTLRDRLKAVIKQVSVATAETFDLKVDIVWNNEMPAVRNSASLVDLATTVLPDSVETERLETPPMTTDDFSLLTELGPALYLKLGTRDKDGDSENVHSLHSADFDVDERCIPAGVLALESLVRAVLADKLDSTSVGTGTRSRPGSGV